MREIFEQAVDAAKSLGITEVEAMIGVTRHALTRFANNTIHQNVAEHNRYLSVRVIVDQRTARATTNRVDRESIAAVVEEAAAIARLQQPDPDLLPLAPAAEIRSASRRFESTATATPDERARAVAEAIVAVESHGQTAAGIFSTAESQLCLLNTAGVYCRDEETQAHFSITAMAKDSSGWAKAGACDVRQFDPLALARSAAAKASKSRDPIELPPGRYTVILEPAAVLDLAGQIFGDFSATALRDGRSFLTDRFGKKIFGENISIYDDVSHPLQSGPPFDYEGVPRSRLTLVQNGVPLQVAVSRQSAHLAGEQATGHGFPLPNEYGEAPANIVVGGGTETLEGLIGSTKRGILVTRLWYIREVDPYDKIMTGMTRDGTFLIEGGEIVRGLRNFRFNQSVIEMLSNVEAMTPAVRASGEETFDMVVPGMKVREFHFTEVTRF